MDFSKLKILIVDDEYGMRTGVERVLRYYKIRFTDFEKEVEFVLQMANTGHEALEAITKDKPDIILLDYKLPDLNGIEIINILRKQQLDILTIMVTAYASLEVAITATKDGAFDFLAKPFTPDELKNTIQKAANHLYHKWKAEKLEKEKNQIRFEFITVLAHELKSPLHAIESYLNTIKQRICGEDLDKYDLMVNRSLTRLEGMEKLIIDILDLTRIESGKMKREPKELNLADIARNCIHLVNPLAKEKNVTITLMTPDTLFLEIDQTELEMILNNLLSNAIKYNRDKGLVELTLEQDGKKTTIRCRDTGLGIKEEDKARLFKEFVRIKNEKTASIPGSGLGLAILKKITHLYKGQIDVESAPDKGSTFTITLPRESEP
jgi:signal transduction histidine kinase